ncbi:RagB/SusD family nutrient uptake outer membrane protein [Chitinophaga sp. OAE865]|uniref:RagB/SusD family nutrient uptake outer membrane protein n=1 Tax=Chitinophaga sp. OAE865 TaxID=2817898 RepID=UPI001AE159D5
MSTKINIAIAFSILTAGCTKSDFLEKKPNTGIVIPSTITDMTQLLDNQTVMLYNAPCTGTLSADEYYYYSLDDFNATGTKTEKNCYTWQKDIYQGENRIPDWNNPYQAIFYSNVVLEQWDKLATVEKTTNEGRFVKGWALYERAYNYLNLVQTFSPAYDKGTAATDLGVPIRLSANINEIKQRASVEDTYNQILNDLKGSITYFTDIFPSQNLNRPSKVAAFGLLARVYLYMREYNLAGAYADSSLLLKSDLIDYNTVSTTASRPFTIYNPEVLKLSLMSQGYLAATLAGVSAVDTALINMYEDTDLRKYIFFKEDKGVYLTKSSYNGKGFYPFTGVAVDELFLIKAETLVRAGQVMRAAEYLDRLLTNRYTTGNYKPISYNTGDELLQHILNERKKELVLRGVRWPDIKRLNKGGANITLRRELGGTNYELLPNDPRYVMPIPSDEIALSHIQQNVR